MGGTGFQGYVEGCAFGVVSVAFGVLQGFDFGVGQAGAMVPSFADDFSAFDQDGADHGIWRGLAVAAAGEAKGELHELSVGHAGAA